MKKELSGLSASILFALIIYSNLITSFVAAQESKDITPEAGSEIVYQNLVADGLGNVFVIKGTNNRKFYFLLKYDGTSWKDLSIHPDGWSGVYSLASDKRGNLFVWGKRTGQDQHVIYTRINDKWDSIPHVPDQPRMRNLYMNPNDELTAFGRFENKDGKFNIAYWRENKWHPVATEIKDKFIRKQMEDGPTQLAFDDKGNIFVYKFRYGPPHSNYFFKWNGDKWQLLDTSKVPVFNVRQMRVVNDVMYVAGSLKDDNKNYALIKWDGAWSVATKVDEKTETVALDGKGNLYLAGDIRRDRAYAILKFDGQQTSTYARSGEPIGETVFANGRVYTLSSVTGTTIFSIAQGDLVEKKYTPVTVTTQPTQPITPATVKKDEKATEVWNIYKSFLGSSKNALLPAFQGLINFFAKDRDGNFVNRVAWKSLSYNLNQEVSKATAYLFDYNKQLQALKLKPGDNDLAKHMTDYLLKVSSYLNQGAEFVELAKYGIITSEVNRSYDEYIKTKTAFENKETELNEIVKKYKARNTL